jgi:chemotaxis signal transduction protein
MNVTNASSETDAVVARLGAGRFAIDLADVAEVGRVPVISRIPGMPGWLAGLTNWRGRILPVLDLRPLMGAGSGSLPASARLVVVTSDGVSVGLLVDAVDGTTTVGSDLAPFPSVLPGTGADLLRGQVPREDGPIAVVDVGAIVRLRDALPRGRHSV